MENPFPAHIPGLPIFTSQRAQSQLLAGLGATNIIQYETLEARLQELFGDGMYGTAVSALYEYAQTRRMKVNFVDVRHAGPDHMPRFVMTAVVDGRPMSRVEASKKSRCKDGSALVAWELLIQEELTQLQKQLSNASNVGDQMALLSNIQYLHVLLNNPKALCGRKALATIVMKTKQNPQGKVVSLGAGNKCIKGENLGNHGNTIHDCHAEVLGRRAFLRFVYEEVEKYVHGNTRADSIFVPSSRSRDHLMVKDGITFHLYISTAPCGDAAVYSRASAMEEKMSTEPLYTSRQQGELRTKIDAGEGTLPIEVPVQTWLGIKHGGTRLRTMSCSDKICKWNVLGMQGALLSHFVEPIYLSSVTIGDCYVYGHITRALYDRLTHQRPQQQQQEQNLRQELQKRGFELNKPALHQSDIDYSCQETERSRTVGVCWYQGINRAEVIDSQTGVCDASVRREVSLFSKRALCGEFFSLCRSTKQEGLMKCMTYSEAKQSAEMYQEAKKVLCKQFTSKGYGTWLYYPLEVDLFSVQDNFD